MTTPLRLKRDVQLEIPADERPRSALRNFPQGDPSSMDVPRSRRRRRVLQLAGIGVAAVVLIAAFVFVASLEPALPVVDADMVWIGTVERGEFVREVRGPGKLVPMRHRWITALTPGRVDEILLQPGTTVSPETPLFRLANPDVAVELLTVRQQLSDAEAELVSLDASLESEELAQRALVLQVRTQYLEARHRDETNRELETKSPGLVSSFDMARGVELVAELEDRLRIEGRRLALLDESAAEQIEARSIHVDRLRSIVRASEQRVDSLVARAGVAGVVAEIAVEEGQWVQAGDTLGRVVQPERLKAELRVPQNQAEQVLIGQRAVIDTRVDVMDGHVARVDPAVRDGAVTVDVSLTAELPASARFNMSVDGTVVIERVADVTYMTRPVAARPEERLALFRLDDGGEVAERVNVLVGRVSVKEVEVVEGLSPGDRVILSDMSAWDDHERLLLEW
ncbi:MAG: HlyD family efflux transporter periplasmic adaptor subunit [Acidobacteriota bacterium]|nr:HlyD family efflux transporter periplasmic adaptor subunit [Acidobacteriota bacterium]MDE2924601.1 HlyD family efflux transporter periplasmic adaptor subunit [Acidobacteriota bacterium]MDE3264251.1 HlyD family efflux transporter periplasmic adaptor subunit [Acidobacteriota bacterium]